MNIDTSFLNYFLNAGMIVKIVMLLLLLASIFSWIYIFERNFLLKKEEKDLREFESNFLHNENLFKLYQILKQKNNKASLDKIFLAGYKEFIRLNEQKNINDQKLIANVERAMRIAQSKVTEELENKLSFLATVGSTSPYVGLFGTVWGIMTSFSALGGATQATIAVVAPGISEALIATAMGLFAAIPAVIYYNRNTTRIDKILNHCDALQEEFITWVTYQHTHSYTHNLQTECNCFNHTGCQDGQTN